MNEQNNGNKRYLEVGLEVLYTGGDKKQHKAKITEVFTQSAARVESSDGQNTAIAEYSETGEVNTFQFPSSATASAEAEEK
jgi:hypothetical protein